MHVNQAAKQVIKMKHLKSAETDILFMQVSLRAAKSHLQAKQHPTLPPSKDAQLPLQSNPIPSTNNPNQIQTSNSKNKKPVESVHSKKTPLSDKQKIAIGLVSYAAMGPVGAAAFLREVSKKDHSQKEAKQKTNHPNLSISTAKRKLSNSLSVLAARKNKVTKSSENGKHNPNKTSDNKLH